MAQRNCMSSFLRLRYPNSFLFSKDLGYVFFPLNCPLNFYHLFSCEIRMVKWVLKRWSSKNCTFLTRGISTPCVLFILFVLLSLIKNPLWLLLKSQTRCAFCRTEGKPGWIWMWEVNASGNAADCASSWTVL